MKVKCRKVKVDILAFCAPLLSFCQQAEAELYLEHAQQTSLHPVQQVVCSSQPSGQPYVDSHWGEVTQMCTMQQII